MMNNNNKNSEVYMIQKKDCEKCGKEIRAPNKGALKLMYDNHYIFCKRKKVTDKNEKQTKGDSFDKKER